MFLKVLVICSLIYLTQPTAVTFKNVVFSQQEMFIKPIKFSNRLKDYLSGSPNSNIKISHDNVPVLYKDSFVDLKVNDLVLENCHILKIHPGCFRNSSMRKLSLKENKIKKIEKGVFNKVNVSWIDLSDNRIRIIHSKAFDNLPALQILDLSYNRIKKWDSDWFKNTPQLTQVNLQKNHISKLFKNTFHNLGGKKNYSFEATVFIDIDLSYNKIKTIEPDAFNGLSELKNLQLNNNLLEKFDVNLLQNISIEYLYLNKNKIRCLEGDLSKIVKSNETYLNNNPFYCKCLSNIKDWIEQNNITVVVSLPFISKCDL